jgi:hypothetical protein
MTGQHSNQLNYRSFKKQGVNSLFKNFIIEQFYCLRTFKSVIFYQQKNPHIPLNPINPGYFWEGGKDRRNLIFSNKTLRENLLPLILQGIEAVEYKLAGKKYSSLPFHSLPRKRRSLAKTNLS